MRRRCHSSGTFRFGVGRIAQKQVLRGESYSRGGLALFGEWVRHEECVCEGEDRGGGAFLAHVLVISRGVCETAYICFLIFEPPPNPTHRPSFHSSLLPCSSNSVAHATSSKVCLAPSVCLFVSVCVQMVGVFDWNVLPISVITTLPGMLKST